MTTILHITPHLGTGIGKSLSSLAIGDKQNRHEIVLLEKPQNTFFNDRCDRHGIPQYVTPDRDTIRDKIIESDIVQVEFWHHALQYQFLHDLPKFPMRLVIWDHVNGCHHPYLKPELAECPTKFVATGQYTLENPHWTEQERERMRQAITVVNSSGGFAGFDRPLEPHTEFNVGFIGTLDYSKVHPEIIDYFAAVAFIPDIQFRIIGAGPEAERMKAQVKERGLENKFTFTGFVPDASVELAKLDVYAHLLNPKTFDTTENALLENMAMGIPPVVLNQGSEKHIVKKGTGFKINNINEFCGIITELYANSAVRLYVGAKAKRYVRKTFSCENMVKGMQDVYNDVLMYQPSKVMRFGKVIGDTPGGWFLSSLAPGREAMQNRMVQGDTKLSVRNWLRYFPDDKKLQEMKPK